MVIADPDFLARSRFLQSELSRVRASYRSPLSSSDLNFCHNALVNDLEELYIVVELLKLKRDDRFDKIYKSGGNLTTEDEFIPIEKIISDLKYIRMQVQAFK